jgi:hypothetical protein
MNHQQSQDIRYWRERCAELKEDNDSLRDQLQVHVTALHNANMVIVDGDLVSLNDEEEQ